MLSPVPHSILQEVIFRGRSTVGRDNTTRRAPRPGKGTGNYISAIGDLERGVVEAEWTSRAAALDNRIKMKRG